MGAMRADEPSSDAIWGRHSEIISWIREPNQNRNLHKAIAINTHSQFGGGSSLKEDAYWDRERVPQLTLCLISWTPKCERQVKQRKRNRGPGLQPDWMALLSSRRKDGQNKPGVKVMLKGP